MARVRVCAVLRFRADILSASYLATGVPVKGQRWRGDCVDFMDLHAISLPTERWGH